MADANGRPPRVAGRHRQNRALSPPHRRMHYQRNARGLFDRANRPWLSQFWKILTIVPRVSGNACLFGGQLRSAQIAHTGNYDLARGRSFARSSASNFSKVKR
jgi:hypothetical protein